MMPQASAALKLIFRASQEEKTNSADEWWIELVNYLGCGFV